MTTLVSFSHTQFVIWLLSADFTGALCVLVLGIMTRYGAIEIVGTNERYDAWCEAGYGRHDRNLYQRGRDILNLEARLSQPKRSEW